MGHTPGPWYCHVHTAVAEESDGEYGTATCITTVDEEEYTRVGHRGDLLAWVPHDRRHEENARLIAAAPELLAALKDVCRFERFIQGMHPGVWPVIHKAIAKAGDDRW